MQYIFVFFQIIFFLVGVRLSEIHFILTAMAFATDARCLIKKRSLLLSVKLQDAQSINIYFIKVTNIYFWLPTTMNMLL